MSRPGAVSCEAALRQIAGEAGVALDEALALFLSSDDLRGPHRARVALRRLTTCLDAFAPLMRKKALAPLRAEAKAMFRGLGVVRDSDVYTADRATQSGHAKRLRKTEALREKTRARLRRDKAVTFVPRLVTALAPDSPLYRVRPGALEQRAAPIAPFAAGLLETQWQRCCSFGPSVAAIPARSRHEFRKEMKAMRYLSEFFEGVFPGLSEDPFRADFRDLQDALGVLNDFEVARAIEGRKRPKALPEREAGALETAEGLWNRLSAAPPPWQG